MATDLHSQLETQLRQHFGGSERVPAQFRDLLRTLVAAHQESAANHSALESRLQIRNRVLVELAQRRLTNGADLAEVARAVTEGGAEGLGVGRVGIWLIEDDGAKLKLIDLYQSAERQHTAGSELATLDYPVYMGALQSERTIAAEDAFHDPRVAEFTERYHRPHGIVSVLDAPIRVGGKVVGVVCHESVGAPRRWAPEDESFAGWMAEYVALALEGAERKRTEHELWLVASALENTLESVMISDRSRRIVYVNAAYASMTGYAAAESLGRSPEFLRSGMHPQSFYDRMWEELARGGRWKGEIWSRRKNGDVYPALFSISAVNGPDGEPHHFVSVFNDISHHKDYEQRLEFLAHHDALTLLPNRILYQERCAASLNRARRLGHNVAVLFLDLDRFKTINDSLGHAMGDQLLKGVAERFTSCLRASDTVARLGGDEFAVLLDDLPNTQSAAVAAQKLLDSFGQPFNVAGHELYTSASIGIACFPQDGSTIEDLLRNSDAAMYRAKEHGRNGYQYFSAEMNAQAFESLMMANNLRQALEREQLRVVYQPVVDLAGGRVTGVEALVRWRHPDYGEIAPERFIPVAEATGMIGPIGHWVLESALRQLRAWQDSGLAGLRVAVNLSARQLARPDFVREVDDILRRSRVAPQHLVLELTESVMMQYPERVRRVLAQLHEMGTAVAVDDFGTGYSSLSYLKQFPIDYLKIDKSFVAGVPGNADDMAIARAVIAMGRQLNLKLVAEGVETAAQLEFLRAEGCHEAQGFHYARPLPAAELEVFLRKQRG